MRDRYRGVVPVPAAYAIMVMLAIDPNSTELPQPRLVRTSFKRQSQLYKSRHAAQSDGKDLTSRKIPHLQIGLYGNAGRCTKLNQNAST